jgi:threonine aldolase
VNFASDNAVGAAPRIVAALTACNDGATPAYGADPLSERAARLLCEIFERDCAVFLVTTGTAANALALAALSPAWGAVLCHEEAHIHEDECGAPEFYTGGAKLVGIPGIGGKIGPDALAATLRRFPRGVMHHVQGACLSLSQATEAGTVYTPAEIAALAEIARGAGLAIHMDGARFVNALVALGCTPAELTWKAGIDILSFGLTKNGAIACEAVVVFDPAKAASLPFLRKRGGHTWSKGRFLGAQMVAMLEGDYWLDLARHANAAAARLAAGLAAIPGARLAWPCEVNEVFPILPRAAEQALKARGARYHEWVARSVAPELAPRAGEVPLRLVTSFATTAAEVDHCIAIVRDAVEKHPPR